MSNLELKIFAEFIPIVPPALLALEFNAFQVPDEEKVGAARFSVLKLNTLIELVLANACPTRTEVLAASVR